jgi:hypothetical protein
MKKPHTRRGQSLGRSGHREERVPTALLRGLPARLCPIAPAGGGLDDQGILFPGAGLSDGVCGQAQIAEAINWAMP